MLFCKFCKKEVVIYGASYSPGVEEHLEVLRKQLEEEGKLILFNPQPRGPYRCPRCFRIVEEK